MPAHWDGVYRLIDHHFVSGRLHGSQYGYSNIDPVFPLLKMVGRHGGETAETSMPRSFGIQHQAVKHSLSLVFPGDGQFHEHSSRM
jgi:hypothetical protein